MSSKVFSYVIKAIKPVHIRKGGLFAILGFWALFEYFLSAILLNGFLIFLVRE